MMRRVRPWASYYQEKYKTCFGGGTVGSGAHGMESDIFDDKFVQKRKVKH